MRGTPCGLPAVPVALAAALMQFASKDVTHAMMAGFACARADLRRAHDFHLTPSRGRGKV